MPAWPARLLVDFALKEPFRLRFRRLGPAPPPPVSTGKLPPPWLGPGPPRVTEWALRAASSSKDADECAPWCVADVVARGPGRPLGSPPCCEDAAVPAAAACRSAWDAPRVKALLRPVAWEDEAVEGAFGGGGMMGILAICRPLLLPACTGGRSADQKPPRHPIMQKG